MNSLFPVEPEYPEGFVYLPAFISEEEERELLGFIGMLDLQAFLFQGFEAKRRVASFGWDWHFDTQTLTKGKDIPAAFQWLVKRVSEQFPIQPESFAELLVTGYPKGAVINWHRDAPPFALIAGLSLHADCLFKLQPHEKERQSRKSVISLPVQRRSLYVLQGSAREAWQHSIAAVEKERYSITLRTLKPGFSSPV